MRCVVLRFVVCLVVLAVAGPAAADFIPIPNGGFESPALADGGVFGGVAPAPWTKVQANVVLENPLGIGAGVVEGEQRVRLATQDASSAFLFQTLPLTYQPNTVYVFSIVPMDIGSGLVPDVQIGLEGLGFTRVNGANLFGVLGQEIAVAGAVLPNSPPDGDRGSDRAVACSGRRNRAPRRSAAHSLPAARARCGELCGIRTDPQQRPDSVWTALMIDRAAVGLVAPFLPARQRRTF